MHSYGEHGMEVLIIDHAYAYLQEWIWEDAHEEVGESWEEYSFIYWNHWQTEETMKIYLNQLRLNFSKLHFGSIVGIVYNKAPLHAEVLQLWVDE